MKITMKQSGNAVTEFMAMFAVLAPLFILIPALGRISDMNQSSIEASRYLAWERTVASSGQKSDGQLATEVRRRYFSNIDAFIKTNDTAQDQDGYRVQSWHDHSGKWMLRKFDDVTVGTQNSETPGAAAQAVAGAMSTFITLLGKFNTSADFDLDSKGLYRAEVNVNVGSINIPPFNQGTDCANQQTNETFLCLRRHNVILADTWSASDPAHTERRVKALVPAGIFDKVSKLTDAISAIPFLQEFDGFKPGFVVPDVIPADRLGPYQE